MRLEDLSLKYNPEADLSTVALPPLPPGTDLAIAFDQALDKTGVFRYDGTSTAAWTVRSPKWTQDLTGHEKTLARSIALQQALLDLLLAACAEHSRILVLHETPAVAKGKMSRPESSLLGAHCIRWAVQTLGATNPHDAQIALVMVSGQRAKTVTTGNPRAEKANVHAALRSTYAPQQVGVASNGDERDALALLVTHLLDTHLKEQS